MDGLAGSFCLSLQWGITPYERVGNGRRPSTAIYTQLYSLSVITMNFVGCVIGVDKSPTAIFCRNVDPMELSIVCIAFDELEFMKLI